MCALLDVVNMGRFLCVVLCLSIFLQQGRCQFEDFIRITSRIADTVNDRASDLIMVTLNTASNTISEIYKLLGINNDDDDVDEGGATTDPAPTTTNSPAYYVELPEPPDCGISSAGQGRVVDGDDAKLGEFPWMAVLNFKAKGIVFWLCGGSLVSSRHVLTAAHCLHPSLLAQQLSFVRLGELDYARDDDGATPLDVLVVEKIKHEQYNKKTKANDIALLVLEREVTFTELIKPICLPRSQAQRTKNFERYNPFAAGWGKTKANGESSTHLQVVQITVLKNKPCIDAFPREYKIGENVLCVGSKVGTKDTCGGDSGGPLMLTLPFDGITSNQPPMYQIGIVAYGIEDCGKAPGVYTKVSHYVPWIEEKITGRIGKQHSSV